MPFRIGDHADSPAAGKAGQGRAEQGTLLWIGSREPAVYRDAYAYCDCETTQVAYRSDLSSAIERPATDVKLIVLCCDNDSSERVTTFSELRRRHESADAVLLMGPLCAGSRPSPTTRFDAPGIYWHQWDSTLGRHSGLQALRETRLS